MKKRIDSYASYIVLISLAINVFGLIWAWLALRGLEGPLIIAFGPVGIIEVGPLPQMLMIPVTGLVFALVDFLILQKLPRGVSSRGSVAMISLATALLLFMAVFAIIRANV